MRRSGEIAVVKRLSDSYGSSLQAPYRAVQVRYDLDGSVPTNCHRLALIACLAGVACGARAHPHKPPPAVGDDVTLYRDWAVIRQRIELDVPAVATTVKVQIAAGVAADQVMLIDRGGITITALHAQT